MAVKEMQITMDDLRDWPFLHRIAGLWNVVLGTFDKADPLAIAKQEEHRKFVRWAAPCATAAVCVAIGELGGKAMFSLEPLFPVWVISVCVAAAVISGWGAVRFFQAARRSGEKHADRAQRRLHPWHIRGAAVFGTAAIGLTVLGTAAVRAS
jgi:hypothetical protein